MQLLGNQLKAHEFVLKVLVANTEYHFWVLFKKNHSQNMATPWTLVNQTNVLLCEVWLPELHLHALIAEGKTRYMRTRQCTHIIFIWDGQGSNLIRMHESHWLETCLGPPPQHNIGCITNNIVNPQLHPPQLAFKMPKPYGLGQLGKVT